ncbi:hypothetical protein MTR_3g463090 [Medicago truncatula]|uniref:Uncharacterized protein n=1 Tax=Medicago truncatula TaxID=3880 RepID=G7ZYH2_MEDTR|nr:hypothetical protein MTR_3g463090 [Medicago truncatula]
MEMIVSGVSYTFSLRCSNGTTSHGIKFDIGQGDPLVIRYNDSNYVGDMDDAKSTT